MNVGQEVLYRTPARRGEPSLMRPAVVIGHTPKRVRIQDGRWIRAVAYRNVKIVPRRPSLILSEASEGILATPLGRAVELANHSLNIDIKSVRFVDPEVTQ